jgi:Holliday junction DNA helicase RuvB
MACGKAYLHLGLTEPTTAPKIVQGGLFGEE